MRVRHLRIQNFRGIEDSEIHFKTHTLLVGGNNAGKSMICEALDLVLGPERLYRRPVVDEHDFYLGRYLNAAAAPIEIRIDVVLTQLTPEERRRFGDQHLRLWDENASEFIDEDENGVDRSGDGAAAIAAQDADDSRIDATVVRRDVGHPAASVTISDAVYEGVDRGDVGCRERSCSLIRVERRGGQLSGHVANLARRRASSG
ncbi:ATP-dependent endonuclease [Frigoribacterium sp. 9N]|uniref:ATP-dependent nuclease n=1 Tax=Frigoribacterium sp. 9N TaxID=2653144 RepID=UPI0019169CBD|nr:AAA family ATPase [Frigoribacterium sp. 9N]